MTKEKSEASNRSDIAENYDPFLENLGYTMLAAQ